jgi:hypothetical protein
MNTRKILLSLTMVLILIMSVSVASAGIIVKTPFSPERYVGWGFINPKIINNPLSPTPLGDCIKSIFHKCPTPIPTPTPTPIITPTPTTSPTPIPTPNPISTLPSTSTGDISVSGSAATLTVPKPPESLFILVGIRNTFNHAVDTIIEVQIFASNGQTIPLYQFKYVSIGANSADTQIFEFNGITEPGNYQVRISSPVLNGETPASNNVYNFNIVGPSVPTPTPTPVPAPVNTFDVTVTAKIPAQINVGDSLNILTTVAHNRKKTVEDKLWVTVTGPYPASVSEVSYSLQTFKQSKELIMSHHDTVISDEDTWFYFPTNGWNPGIYHVTVLFPAISGEVNTVNNKYEADVKVVGAKQPDITDVGLTVFNFELYYDLPEVSDGSIVRGVSEPFA